LRRENQKDFLRNFGKYFKVSDIKQITADDNYKYTRAGNSLSDLTGTTITLTDGTMIFDWYFDNKDFSNVTDTTMKGQVGFFHIDLNGFRKPNIVGRDIFYFFVGDNGIVYPYGSKITAGWKILAGESVEGFSNYWNDSVVEYNSRCTTKVMGEGCTARVLEEGKMNY